MEILPLQSNPSLFTSETPQGGSNLQSSKWCNLRAKCSKFSGLVGRHLKVLSSQVGLWSPFFLYYIFHLPKKFPNDLKLLQTITGHWSWQRQEADDNLEWSLCGFISGLISSFLHYSSPHAYY